MMRLINEDTLVELQKIQLAENRIQAGGSGNSFFVTVPTVHRFLPPFASL